MVTYVYNPNTLRAEKRQRQKDCHESEAQPRLQSEFQVNLVYKVRLCLRKTKLKFNMVGHVYIPSTWEAEVGRLLRLQGLSRPI